MWDRIPFGQGVCLTQNWFQWEGAGPDPDQPTPPPPPALVCRQQDSGRERSGSVREGSALTRAISRSSAVIRSDPEEPAGTMERMGGAEVWVSVVLNTHKEVGGGTQKTAKKSLGIAGWHGKRFPPPPDFLPAPTHEWGT